MGQFHFDPAAYRELMRTEVPAYERLQAEVARAAAGGAVAAVLDLGTGTGETARAVLADHPGARLVGVDVSPLMLAEATQTLAGHDADLVIARLEDPLPTGPFDLAVSALAVHHLPGRAKPELFQRVAAVLRPGGRFVLGDVVVPADPAAATTPLSPGYDHPSTVAEQLTWLREARFTADRAWEQGDLAVLAATLGR